MRASSRSNSQQRTALEDQVADHVHRFLGHDTPANLRSWVRPNRIGPHCPCRFRIRRPVDVTLLPCFWERAVLETYRRKLSTSPTNNLVTVDPVWQKGQARYGLLEFSSLVRVPLCQTLIVNRDVLGSIVKLVMVIEWRELVGLRDLSVGHLNLDLGFNHIDLGRASTDAGVGAGVIFSRTGASRGTLTGEVGKHAFGTFTPGGDCSDRSGSVGPRLVR